MSNATLRIGITTVLAWIIFATGIGMDAAAKKEGEKMIGPGVLSFEEISRNSSKIRTINASEDKVLIVDINSQLKIKIDKQAVKKHAAEQLNIGIPAKMVDEISAISTILAKEAEILGYIGEGTGLDEQTRKKNLQIFSSKMRELQGFILANPELSKKVNEKMENSDQPSDDYQYIFSVVREEIERISNQYNQVFAGLNFRLGGWINRGATPEPIHIEGFDTIQRGEFYEFPFFVPPTPEEWEKLQKLPEEAKNINEKGLSAVLNIKGQLQQYAAGLETEVKNALDCTLKSLTTIKGQIISQASIDFKEQFKATNDIIQKVKNLLDLLQQMKKVIQDLDILPDKLEQNVQLVQSLSTAIKTDIATLPDDLKNAKQELEKGLLGGGALATLEKDVQEGIKNGLAQIKNNCLKDILATVANAKNAIENMVTLVKDELIKNLGLMSPQWGAALELSDKVERFAIDKIPDEGDVDLRYLGKRDEGNELYFKAVLETKPKEGEDKVQAVTVDEKYFMMFKMVYIKLKPALVFAAPLMAKAERAEHGITLSQTKTFQAVASYSVLLKLGNRQSVAYNRFFRVGFGLNVAALDFNQDSNYEVGLGLVLSGFNDFVQVGVGRNLDIDANYFFFGINLPIGEISLPKLGAAGGAQ
jgi:hypothetical protein